jgi:hypothetical protein
METADVRRRVKDALDRVKRQHAERRTRTAQASAVFEVFLQRSAIPVMQQVAGALKAEGYLYLVNTPAGSVRLASEKSGSDFIDIGLDTSGNRPQVTLRVERVRGRDHVAEERPLKPGALIENLTEEDVLDAVVEAIETLVDR